MTTVPLLERIARKERLVVLAGVAVVTVLGLLATLRTGDRLMMTSPAAGNVFGYAALLFAMWWTMMMAMMLPSAAPAILIYGTLSRRFAASDSSAAPVAMFVAGYVLIWTGFSVGAVLLQLLLGDVIALSMMMAATSTVVGGGLLVAAGAYQLAVEAGLPEQMPVSPHLPRPALAAGNLGALRMGLQHGIYCLGCCWVLMGLLFYGGVMELRWIVGLALYVALEKLVPAGNRLSQFSGLLLIGWGCWTLYSTLR